MSRLIAQLDRALAKDGETITLSRRVSTSSTARLPVRARLKGFEARELVGSITQQDRRLIMSPSEIIAAGSAWPGTAAERWPRKNDLIEAIGGNFAVQSGGPIVIDGEVVRLEYVVRGGA